MYQQVRLVVRSREGKNHDRANRDVLYVAVETHLNHSRKKCRAALRSGPGGENRNLDDCAIKVPKGRLFTASWVLKPSLS